MIHNVLILHNEIVHAQLIDVLPLHHRCNKSSAIAELAAQCCTSRIFAFEWT